MGRNQDPAETTEYRTAKESEGGMISLEMLLFLSLYVMFFSGLLLMMDQMIMQYRLKTAVMETAREAATFSALDVKTMYTSYQMYKEYGALNRQEEHLGWKEMGWELSYMNTFCKAATNAEAGWNYNVVFLALLSKKDPDLAKHMEQQLVQNGTAGLSFRNSEIGGDGVFTLTLNYRSKGIRIPFTKDSYLLSWDSSCSATTRAWK